MVTPSPIGQSFVYIRHKKKRRQNNFIFKFSSYSYLTLSIHCRSITPHHPDELSWNELNTQRTTINNCWIQLINLNFKELQQQQQQKIA